MRFFIITLCLLVLALPQHSIAQQTKQSAIIQEAEDGEIIGCGFEFTANNQGYGVQGKAIVTIANQIQQQLSMLIGAAKIEDGKVVQTRVRKATIHFNHEKFRGSVPIVMEDGRVFSDLPDSRKIGGAVFKHMLQVGFLLEYETSDGTRIAVKFQPNEALLEHITYNCHLELLLMISQRYREYQQQR